MLNQLEKWKYISCNSLSESNSQKAHNILFLLNLFKFKLKFEYH